MTPEPLHLDTAPAIQAAFALGRAEYLRDQKNRRWEAGGGMERVLRALSNVPSYGGKCSKTQNITMPTQNITMPTQNITMPTQNISPVVGGGDSLAGKIRWLIENEEPRTSRQLAERLGVHVSNVSTSASRLFRRGSIGRSGRMFTKIGEVAA